MLERNPELKADELRAILMQTARDLGSPGRDDQFGAGEADAFAATAAAIAGSAMPISAKEPAKASEATSRQMESQSGPAVAAMASDKSTATEPHRPAPR